MQKAFNDWLSTFWDIYKSIYKLLNPKPKYGLQQVAAWASEDGGSPDEGFTHGCRPCRAAKGGPPFCSPCGCCWGTPNPLLNASACRESISRFAAWRSASRSSAVCLLRRNC